MPDTKVSVMIHIPGLQPELACSSLPSTVRFVSPGLPKTDAAPFWVSGELPFSSTEARACLNEMITLGEQFRNTRDLVTLALQPSGGEQRKDASFREEMKDLDAFEATGESGQRVDEDSVEREKCIVDSAIAAQKTLILAWNLESRVHELKALQSSFAHVAESFRNVLGVDDEDISELPGVSNVVAELSGGAGDVTGMSWRTVVDAVLRFAPADAVFITCDTRLVSALRELTDVVAPDGDLPQDIPGATGMCRIAAWSLLGHSRVPEKRPWLDRELRILLCE